MSNFGAQITFQCDRCRNIYLTIHLRDAGGGSFDFGGVDEELSDRGWTKDGDSDICPDCSKGGEDDES